jgi:hypothetical protein
MVHPLGCYCLDFDRHPEPEAAAIASRRSGGRPAQGPDGPPKLSYPVRRVPPCPG